MKIKSLKYIFFIVSAYFTISILFSLAGINPFITGTGKFLLSKFSLAAFYIPWLFVFGGLLLNAGRFPRRSLLILWLSAVPFLTLSILFQLIKGNTEILSSGVLINTLGQLPSVLLFILLFALEITSIVKLSQHFNSREDVLYTSEDIKNKILNILSFLGFVNSSTEDVPVGEEEPTLEDAPYMEYPPFPEMPDFPGSSVSDPDISSVLNRVLTGEKESGDGSAGKEINNQSSAAQKENENSLQNGFPEVSAFMDSSEENNSEKNFQSSSGEKNVNFEEDPAFAYLSKEIDNDYLEEEISEILMPELKTDNVPAENAFESAVSEIEEEKVPENISEKLNPHGSEPAGVVAEIRPKKNRSRKKRYFVPVEGILAEYSDSDFSSVDEATRRAGEILEQTLKEFRIEAKVIGIRKGPVITMYELLPSPGVKISSIVNLQDNIALRLAASRVRIVAPIPGKHAVGIEVPNKKRAIVSFSSIVESDEFIDNEANIPVILGKDISGENQVIDLTRTPHLLIAGATGSGKSVSVNSLIASILYSRTPQDVKLLMIDPKIVELKLYNDIPHLLTPVITEPKRALQALQWCLYEMERRYSLLDSLGARDIKTYNKRVKDRKLATNPIPYIVVIVDEFADLMATSGKELEGIVARLAAMSRAVGIHMVLATQRPSVDVITGLIKANFPSRVAFMVAGKTDSRIIIDSVGAEKLLGRGDMLFTSAWDPFPSRMQGAFLSEEEVERLAEHVKTLGEPDYIDEEIFIDNEEDDFQLESVSTDDPMYEKALEIVVTSGKASASYLQRRLKIGYNRAARLVEEMESRGIVGPANGSKPRDVLHVPDRFISSRNLAEPSSA